MIGLLKHPQWRLVFLLALVTTLSGMFLVGVSGWFLSAVAIAGLGPAAIAFNFHAPAALVRLLALVRTGGKYAERVLGHGAALADQARNRTSLFKAMADAPATRQAGWQLARTDRLEAFLGDVEAVDFERLRRTIPTATALLSVLILLLLTAFITPWAVPVLLVLLGTGLTFARFAAARAAKALAEAADARSTVGAELGQALGALPSLAATGRRDSAMKAITKLALDAEAAGSRAKAWTGYGDAALGLLGIVSAMIVLLAGFLGRGGVGGDAMLPVMLAAFAWLAFGEITAPLTRQLLAGREAARARRSLASWQSPAKDGQPAVQGIEKDRVTANLVSPDGAFLDGSLAFPLRLGEPVAILGPSGCGKTSLLKALAGWLPWPGPGPHPLGGMQLARERTHLSLHDAAVLTGTVRANLFTDKPDPALWQALHDVELLDRIASAGGLDALIGQETLSLGEARRLALARAILSDRPIILLDEPGEHLRKDQAERVMTRLLDRLDGQRVVFVTHDPALARWAKHKAVIGEVSAAAP